MLPSISNLLNDNEDTYNSNKQQAPRLYVIAPSSPCTPPFEGITDSNSTCPSPMSSLCCLSPSFPPSPIDSPLPSMFDVISSDDDGSHLHPLLSLQDYVLPLGLKNTTLSGSVPLGVKDTHITTASQPHRALQLPFFSPSTGQPIFKRLRGRPRTNTLQGLYLNNRDFPHGGFGNNSAGSLTFLTPTTWNVPSARIEPKSSADFDDELRAPRKKRGRKPKTTLQGHSCFVLPSALQRKLKKA